MSTTGRIGRLWPFLWLALAAFLAGLISYIAVGGGAASARPEPRFGPQISAPATDDWNLPKRI